MDPDDLAASTIAACNEDILRGILKGSVQWREGTTPGVRKMVRLAGLIRCGKGNAVAVNEERFNFLIDLRARIK